MSETEGNVTRELEEEENAATNQLDESNVVNTTEEEEREEEEEYTTSQWLEKIGYGNYQRYITFVMGLASFADKAELAVAAIIIKDLACEWDLTILEQALLPAMLYLGEAVGSFIAGKIADQYGRRPILLISYYLICISSVVAICANSYILYIIARALVGVGIGACFPTAACYLHEFSTLNERAQGITFFECVGETGAIYSCICALIVMGLYGWRIELTLILIPSLLTLVLLHFCDESPRYYAISKQKDKALEVLQRVAQHNNSTMPVNGKLRISDERKGLYQDMIKKPYTGISIVLSIVFFSLSFVLNGMFYLIPDMMTYNYCSLSDFFISTYINNDECLVYTNAQYLFFLVIHSSAIPGILLGGLSAEKLGRKPTVIWSNWITLAFTGCVIICIYYIITAINLVLVVLMIYLSICVIWIYAPEIYPTYMRVTSIGVLHGINRIGGAGGSFMSEYVDSYSYMITLYIYMMILSISSLSTLFVRKETQGVVLADQRLTHFGVIDSNTYGTLEQSNMSE